MTRMTWACDTAATAKNMRSAMKRSGVEARRGGPHVIVDAKQGLQRAAVFAVASSYSCQLVKYDMQGVGGAA